MDTSQAAGVAIAVVALTQLLKWAGLRDTWGPVVVIVLSLGGVVLWGYSKGPAYERAMLFDYFVSWISIATSSAGVFGFTRSVPAAVTDGNRNSAPPGSGAKSDGETTRTAGEERSMTFKKIYMMLVAVAFGIAVAACGPKLPPNTSPEGAAAIRGRAVVNAARAALPIIDQQMASGRIPVAAGVQVLKGVREVFVQAGNLANALELVDTAKTAADSQVGTDRAKATLAAIDAALRSGITGLDPGVVKDVLTLLANLNKAIEDVRALLASRAPVLPAPAF